MIILSLSVHPLVSRSLSVCQLSRNDLSPFSYWFPNLQSDETVRPPHQSFVAFMLPKCLALFTKLPSSVCLESLINSFRLCSHKKTFLKFLIPPFSNLFIFQCVRQSPHLCQCVASLTLPRSSIVWSVGSKVCHFSWLGLVSYFHYADEGGQEERRTLGRRGYMLLLCTTLFGTLAALHTCHPPRHTLSACSLSHFFLQRQTHAWWDHTPGPGAGVYYVWVGLSSRCLVSRLGKPYNDGEVQHLSVTN